MMNKKNKKMETMMQIPKMPEQNFPKLETHLPILKKKREIIKKRIDKRTKLV